MKRYRTKNDIWEETLRFSHIVQVKVYDNFLRLSSKKKKRKWCREERSLLEIESLSVPLSILFIEKRRNIWRILISIPSSHSASRLLENIWDNIFPAFSSRFSRLLLKFSLIFSHFFGVFRFNVSLSRIFSTITFAICWLWCISLLFWHFFISAFPHYSFLDPISLLWCVSPCLIFFISLL